MLLEGLQLPLTTPFYADGRVNLKKLEYNVERYSKTPVAGLVALSRWGESAMLSDEESRQVLRGAVEAAAPEKVLLAGVSRDSLIGTLDLAEHAHALGYDAVLVKCPSMLAARGSGEMSKALLTYFQSVADRSALPLVLDGAALSVEFVTELAGHPRMLGLIESLNEEGGRERVARVTAATSHVRHEASVTSVFAAVTGRMKARNGFAATGSLIAAETLAGGAKNSGVEAAVASPPKAVIKTRTKTIGFQILAAGTGVMLEGLRAGAVGAMPGFAASAPQGCYEVLAAWKDGDEPLAEEKQARLRDVATRIETALGVAGIKYGCDLNGYYGGWPRMPQLPLSGMERAEVEGLMQGLRN